MTNFGNFDETWRGSLIYYTNSILLSILKVGTGKILSWTILSRFYLCVISFVVSCRLQAPSEVVVAPQGFRSEPIAEVKFTFWFINERSANDRRWLHNLITIQCWSSGCRNWDLDCCRSRYHWLECRASRRLGRRRSCSRGRMGRRRHRQLGLSLLAQWAGEEAFW